MTSDPIGLEAGLNPYVYVMNNPSLFIDETGLICTYSQFTHQLTCVHNNGQVYINQRENIYSGKGRCKNNPDCGNQKDWGPLPDGWWKIGEPYTSPKGRPTRRLTPLPGNSVYMSGRDPNSFLAHGDSIDDPGNASEGCLIAPPWIRELIPNGELLWVSPGR